MKNHRIVAPTPKNPVASTRFKVTAMTVPTNKNNAEVTGLLPIPIPIKVIYKNIKRKTRLSYDQLFQRKAISKRRFSMWIIWSERPVKGGNPNIQATT